MISDVIKFGGIYAKTCALRSELLRREDYLKLASSDNVRSFAEALGERPAYKESVSEAIAFGANRVAIERSLSKSMYRDYAALYAFITDQKERNYLDAIYLKYAVGIIKRLIRRLFDHRDIHNAIPQYEGFIKRHLGINAEKIEESQSMDELLDNVRGTEFFDVLSKIDKEKATLFDYEMRLDFYCFARVRECQEKYLDKKNRSSERNINGADVDLQNIMWIYRAKTFYDISEDTIFTYLIPIHHKLSAESVKELVKSEDRQSFLDILNKTHYKDVFGDFSAETMEINARKYMSKLYEAERKKNPYSLASVSAHLYFKGQEIRNLTTLIECVRYQLSPQAALKKLSPVHIEDMTGFSDAN